MESSIIRRLETVKEEIFAAAASDGSSAAFTEKWTTLQQDINHASQTGRLSRETHALIFQTASMVCTLAEFFVKLERGHKALSSKLTSDLNEIFGQVRSISWVV